MPVIFEESSVRFRDLNDREIEQYINTGLPMDKAGSYGIQDRQHNFIEEVSGSISNIMGLPMERLVKQFEALEE